ncbi:NDR1/HIN1-like protein 1 [Lathyrus oleraceus]|uniref:NDR1/HIN1-like protein 1 n=1 Tax=Pisum sativum TaxID=3888 RepID=UPI0021CFF17F|nr:NDR1/HIN1-like protein 1 [Pisum sativum]
MTNECESHEDQNRQLIRYILYGILALIILILLTIFLTWIILRPTNPRFILQDIRVIAFNLTSTVEPPSLTTITLTIQVTLSSLNPNSKIGIYYNKLDAYASYRGQQISLPTGLPETYQTHGDISIWSPMLYGLAVPVSPYLSEILRQELTSGGVLVDIKFNGRVKWKVGTWVSGRYHIDVNCPAFIRVTGDEGGDRFEVSNPAAKFQLSQSCVVDV